MLKSYFFGYVNQGPVPWDRASDQLKHQGLGFEEGEIICHAGHSLPALSNYRISLWEVSTQESQLEESINKNKAF